MNIEVLPITPSIGAEIRGVDASEPLEPQTVKEIDEALLDHLVIFFRDQHLTDKQFKAFGAQLGTLIVHPHLPNLGGDLEEVQILEADLTTGKGRADKWHSDATFEAEPPLGSILMPVKVPSIGGDTLWASMYAAYDALSPSMQELLAGLTATHAGGTFGALADEPPSHPVVRTHPATGRKGIFVSELFATRIDGFEPAESAALLGLLARHCSSPMFQVRWRWRPGDIGFWDNRSTQHYGVFDYDEERCLHRLTLRGDRPF